MPCNEKLGPCTAVQMAGGEDWAGGVDDVHGNGQARRGRSSTSIWYAHACYLLRQHMGQALRASTQLHSEV